MFGIEGLILMIFFGHKKHKKRLLIMDETLKDTSDKKNLIEVLW